MVQWIDYRVGGLVPDTWSFPSVTLLIQVPRRVSLVHIRSKQSPEHQNGSVYIALCFSPLSHPQWPNVILCPTPIRRRFLRNALRRPRRPTGVYSVGVFFSPFSTQTHSPCFFHHHFAGEWYAHQCHCAAQYSGNNFFLGRGEPEPDFEANTRGSLGPTTPRHNGPELVCLLFRPCPHSRASCLR